MSRRRTVLLMSRGARTHPIFLGLARSLAADHHVVVVAVARQAADFAAIPGVEVRAYATPEVGLDRPQGDLGQLRARATAIEARLGLSAYKAASNYLLYGRLVKSGGGRWGFLEREDEILRAYVGAYEELTRIFEEHAPDLVFYETLDFISSYVAFALAVHHGIFGLELRFSPLGRGRVFPAFGLFRRNILLEHLYAHREEILPASYRQGDDILQDVPAHLAASAYARLHRKMLDAGSPLTAMQQASTLLDPERFVRGIRNARWHARLVGNRLWLERHLSRRIPEEPYVVFFLQHLPEASTCSEAPRWVYQEAVVEQLALNAPSGLRVVVKEHPRSYGSRGQAFFGPLQALPNVTLCHPAVETRALLERADAVVAINGTVGLEALLMGKRVGVLGRSSYAIYRGVRPLNHPEEMYAAMADASWRPETMRQERRDFLAAHLQASYAFGQGEGTALYPPNGGAQWADAIRQTMDFIETRQLKPADFETGLPALAAAASERLVADGAEVTVRGGAP